MPNSIFKKSRILFGAAALLLTLLGVECISMAGLFGLDRFYGIAYQPISKDTLSESDRRGIRKFISGESPYFSLDPSLGWTIRPYGVYGHYQANRRGLRGETDHEQAPSQAKIRIAAFGDSFTHGDEVKIEETWGEKLRAMDARLEFLNFGVSAYGTDQAFLRYQKEGANFNADIVLIGFMTEDMERAVNVFRIFYGGDTHFPLSKPRFQIQGGQLALLPNPLPQRKDYQHLLSHPGVVLKEIGEHDYEYQTRYAQGAYDFLAVVRLVKIARHIFLIRFSSNRIVDWRGTYSTHSEAFLVTSNILREFYKTATQNGSAPLILLFPDRNDLERFRRTGIKRYAPLANFLRENGLDYLDLMDAFQSEGKDKPVSELCGAHYTPFGNEIVAKAVYKFLKEKKFLAGKSGKEADS